MKRYYHDMESLYELPDHCLVHPGSAAFAYVLYQEEFRLSEFIAH